MSQETSLVDPCASLHAEAAPAQLDANAALNGVMDGVDLELLAQRVGTPCYVYSAPAIRTRIDDLQAQLQGLDARICYAVKANSNLAVLKLIAGAGLGADIVSGGELQRVLHAGFLPRDIVFSGVGKTRAEMSAALAAVVGRFNVESEQELEQLQALAQALGVRAKVAIRVNPEVDAATHDKISTGKAENKFGVGFAQAREMFSRSRKYSHVHVDGLHMHIGSQISSLEPYRQAFARVAALARELKASGHPLCSIDVGGGLGVSYRSGHDRPIAVSEYVAAIRGAFDSLDASLILEPGRWLVAEAGILLARVVAVKQGIGRVFLILDAGMNDLIRPSLYAAWHDIDVLASEPRETTAYDVVGPVCETGDTFAVARNMRRCEPGDLVAIRGAGAYAASMASTYNSRPLAAEVMVDAGRYAVVRYRQTFEDMIAGEHTAPNWKQT